MASLPTGPLLSQLRQLEDELIAAAINCCLTDELIQKIRPQIFGILRQLEQRDPSLSWLGSHISRYRSFRTVRRYFEENREAYVRKVAMNERNKESHNKKARKKARKWGGEEASSIYAFSGGLPSLGRRR